MYLSRLILNPRSRRAQSEAAQPYELHRSIMRAFPDQLDPQSERVLFRLEADPHRGALVLLVQSLEAPDWSWLEEPGAKGYLLPVDGPNPAVKRVSLSLSIGQLLAFRLLANPTVKSTLPDPEHPGTPRPVRHGLYKDDQQQAWLQRKAQQSGFRILSANATKQPEAKSVIHSHAAGEEATHKLTFFAVRFDGLLEVTDPAALARIVEAGIGSGKGLGFGLLSLAPAPRS
jgi:CRISPR system Cascade subunit CasE